MALCWRTALAVVALGAVGAAPAEVVRYGVFELDLGPADTAPRVTVSFNGSAFDPAPFLFQNTSSPASKLEWRLRFSPQEFGTYAVSATGVAAPLATSFLCVAPPPGTATAGFVGIGQNRQHFVDTATGHTMVLAGLNIAWPADAQGACAYYDGYFESVRAAGGNYARVWLGPAVVGSFNPLALLREQYTSVDQQAAGLVDCVVASAQRRGIRLLMALDSFNSLCPSYASSNCMWEKSVWNAANGGPLPRGPLGFLQFWSDPTAVAAFAAYAEYAVARWGAYRAVMAWQLLEAVGSSWQFPTIPRSS